jgi:citrate lyase subunit gamma (acyl carrier protein)
MVILKPLKQGEGIILEVNSIVKNQYEGRIKQAVMDVVKQMKLDDVYIIVQDRGALDCTIKARVETAIKRAL